MVLRTAVRMRHLSGLSSPEQQARSAFYCHNPHFSTGQGNQKKANLEVLGLCAEVTQSSIMIHMSYYKLLLKERRESKGFGRKHAAGALAADLLPRELVGAVW